MTRVFLLLGFSLWFLAACSQTETASKSAEADPPTIKADLVIKGGKILTLNPDQPEAEAIAVRDGRVFKVGDAASLADTIGPNTRVMELTNELVLPGFIEGHGHFLSLGQAKMTLRLGNTQSWQEVIDQVAAAVKSTPPGTWILGRGWHQEKWISAPEKTVRGFPTHEALSQVSPDHPVLLNHASGHAVFANAKAMELAGVNEQTPDPAGGEILRDTAGKAIGLFNETAESVVRKAYNQSLSDQSAADREAQTRKAIELATQECLAKGVTSFQDAGSSFADVKRFHQLAAANNLDLRLWLMLGEDNDALAAQGKDFLANNPNTDYVTVGGIKRYIDGALGSRGAWLLEPYEDAPETTGHNVMTLEALDQTAKLAESLGLQLCTHAIGDRGNREVLDLYSNYVKGKDLRWRIEHAQHLNAADIPRFAELGVIASMQGVHCTSDAPFVPKRLGDARSEEGAYVWRKLLESGALINNGTDVPVEDVDPLPNLHAMVTRQPKTGPPFYPSQVFTIQEAIKAYTIDNAYAGFQEKQVGSLEVGKLADMVILSKDITSLPADAIHDTKVAYTLVGGDIKYQAP